MAVARRNSLMPELLTNIAEEIMEFAKAHNLTICTAESCSAGRLAQEFAKTEGASKHFMGGVVSYTKEAKSRVLAVPHDLIASETAVCSGVAEAMARGAVARFGASLGVSITGVAGPEPDEDGNQVGLVYCGVARRNGGATSKHLNSKSSKPEGIIEEACIEAMRLLRSFSFS